MNERLRGLVIQAHPDDKALAAAADISLLNTGVQLDYLTFTDGAARELSNFSGENGKRRLREVRVKEDATSITMIGGHLLDTKKFPDGQLSDFHRDGKLLLSSAISENRPDFLITPHLKDPHNDHSEAAMMALEVAEIPVYFMNIAADDNNELTHIIPVTRSEVRKNKRAFRAHATQTQGLPNGEIRDVFTVMAMSKQLGNEHSFPYAAGLTLVDFSLGDPIGEYLSGKRIVFDRSLNSVGV